MEVDYASDITFCGTCHLACAAERLHADKPELVDFWAQWCPYCRRIAPAFDKVGEQYADTLTAGKINYDEEPQLIQRFGIDTIPTLMLFKSG